MAELNRGYNEWVPILLGTENTAYLGKAHESVQQGSGQEQRLLVQLVLTSHLHQPADHDHAHGLVNVVLGLVVSAVVLHVVGVCQQAQLCLIQVPESKPVESVCAALTHEVPI